MVSLNKKWCMLTASILSLALWTVISINTSVFTFNDGTFDTFSYIVSYVLVLGFWGLISLKIDFDRTWKNITAYAVFILVPFISMQMSMIYAGIPEFTLDIYFLNIVLYLFVLLLFYGITGSTRWAGIITLSLAYTLSTVSFVVNMFRGTPLIPSDFLAVGTALKVAENYTFKLKYQMIFASIIFIFSLVLCFKFKPDIKSIKAKRISRISGGAAAIVIAFVVSVSDFSSFDVDMFDQYHTNNTHGILLGFYINTQKMILKAPKDYDRTAVEEQLKSYPDDGKMVSKDRPNILVIMNESFADLKVLGELKTNEDYMPFINSLDENVIKGELLVSPFGGYTCNTEFELLTGLTMGLLPNGSAPYLQYISKPYENSLCRHMMSLGYKTLAVHPYYARCWNREKVYGLLGFENFISMDNMGEYQNKNEFEYIRSYMSDRTSYSAVINQFERKKRTDRMFAFNITMQNHGGYTFSDESFKSVVHITNLKGKYPQTEQYLSLIKESDKAFEELLAYFKVFDEPTMIVMFGDHQPGVESGFYEEMLGDKLDNLTTEELQQRYKVPFIIWANYDMEVDSSEYIETSVNYLSNIILDAAGLPKSKMNYFLHEISKEIPQINAMGHYDKDGNWSSNDTDKSDVLKKYAQVEYFMLNEKNQNLK